MTVGHTSEHAVVREGGCEWLRLGENDHQGDPKY